MIEYATFDAFTAGDPRRGTDREADYGLWHDGDDPAAWRVSYDRATGVVYAARLHGGGPVRVYGTIRPDVVLPGMASNQKWFRTCDAVLDGWASSGQDLAWLERALAERGAVLR